MPWWEWKVDSYATSKVATCISVVYIIDALGQKAHKHFNIFHLKHKAVSTLKLSHPSLPGPSPVDSEEHCHDRSVGLHDKILLYHLYYRPSRGYQYAQIWDQVRPFLTRQIWYTPTWDSSFHEAPRYESVLVAKTHL